MTDTEDTSPVGEPRSGATPHPSPEAAAALPTEAAPTPRRPPTPERTPVATMLGVMAAAIIVIASWAALQLWGLEKTPFHTKGEPREALVVAEILGGGGWILPRRNGIELPSKPPLFHWLGAVCARLTGRTDERSIRLPSAVLSGAAVLMVLVTGGLLWGPRAGLVASLALLTSFEWLRAATSARVDMTLSAGLTFAVAGLLLFRSRGGAFWLIIAYAGSAWAVLSKGPVGLALPLGQVVTMCIVDRRLTFLRRLHLVRGALAVALVGGIWYALALLRGGEAFFTKHILTENLWRFLGTAQFTEGHRHSVAYLFLALLAGLLPWTLLLPSAGVALWRDRRALSRQDPRVFLLVWILVVFGFYAVATSKRGVYLLALYPAAALLLGWWIDHARVAAARPRWLPRVVAPIAWGVATIAALVAVVAAAERAGVHILEAGASIAGGPAQREIQDVGATVAAHAGFLLALFSAAAVAAVVTAIAAPTQRWGLVFATLLLSAAPIIVAVRQVVLPAVARTTTRQTFVGSATRVLGGSRDLHSYRRFDYGTVFYWREHIPVFNEPLSASGPLHLVAAAGDWSRADAMERRWYERIPGVESARGGNLGRLFLIQRVAPRPSASGASAADPESAPPP